MLIIIITYLLGLDLKATIFGVGLEAQVLGLIPRGLVNITDYYVE